MCSLFPHDMTDMTGKILFSHINMSNALQIRTAYFCKISWDILLMNWQQNILLFPDVYTEGAAWGESVWHLPPYDPVLLAPSHNIALAGSCRRAQEVVGFITSFTSLAICDIQPRQYADDTTIIICSQLMTLSTQFWYVTSMLSTNSTDTYNIVYWYCKRVLIV